MGQIPAVWHREEDEKEFFEQLSQYDLSKIKTIFEYFKSDFILIISGIRTNHCLDQLASHRLLSKELIVQTKKELGAKIFPEKLLRDIEDAGKESIIEFWRIFLCELDRPTLVRGIVAEINQLGDHLMQHILLDRNGHPMTSKLKKIQEHHKHHHLVDNIVESGGENQPFYISDRYMNLIVTYIWPGQRPHPHSLLDIGVKHEKYLHGKYDRPECISPDRLFNWDQRLKSLPHATLLTGVQGIGKTTLLQKFMCDWANGKFYQKFAFLFYFRFQDLNKLGNISLQSLILQKYPYLESHLENLFETPERLLFIFDGLDESVDGVDFKSGGMCRDVTQAESPGKIVESLVGQSLLQGCSILLATRPDCPEVRNLGVFKRAVEVVGFLPEERRLYHQRFFKNEDLSDRAFRFVKSNGVLYTFTQFPSFCWVICTVLSVCFEGQPASPPPPKTLTQVFTAYLLHILSSYSFDNPRILLTSVGRMAEHGVLNRISRFERQTLSEFNVDTTSPLTSPLLRRNHETFSFRHLFMQDFLAALSYYLDYDPGKLQKTLKECDHHRDNSHYFLSFLCGLSDVSTRSALEPFLGETSSDASKDVHVWLQECTKEGRIFRVGSWSACEEAKRRWLINTLFKVYEMQSEDFVLECFGARGQFDLKSIHLTPLDCTVLAFVLESCRDVMKLHLDMCNLHNESVERLAHVLYKVQTLSLNDNNIGDDGVQFICSALSHPECQIQHLWLSANNLTDRACALLGAAIRDNRTLRTLLLSSNSLGGPHLGDLMNALSSPACKVEELGLHSAGLTHSSCVHLASGIKDNQSLKRLDLALNDLTGPHFGELITALSSPTCAVEELRLQDIILRDEHAPLLVPLSKNKNLADLDLSKNVMSGASITYLRELILQAPSLKELSIYFNHMMSLEDRKELRALKDQKPGLNIFIDG